ncbi:type II secretion system protein GspL [Hydrogenophaga sp. 5NK40-0174]|uniref:type II secretion system protein GspL n=1 Tax=Hydrogenophaga sp. 5NK40-0174 TaxID=3127649 RepID=UPI00310B3E42
MLIVSPAHLSRHVEPGPTAEVEWRSSADGRQIGRQGHSGLSVLEDASTSGVVGLSLLPKDPEVILVLPPLSVSWHRVTLPKAPQNKMRAVLEGLLEDDVLTDAADLHFALEPGAKPGKPAWVAACNKPWLKGWLNALEASGHPVSRIVPALAPVLETSMDMGHSKMPSVRPVMHWAHMAEQSQWVASASLDGASCLPLPASKGDAMHFISGLSRQVQAGDQGPAAGETLVEWMADPAVSALAEAALQNKVELITTNEWLLRATQGRWNLAQFDLTLSSRTRAGQRWREGWRQWLSAPQWRPVRWGAASLVAISLLGLNLTAWQESYAIDAKKAYAARLFKETFPNQPMVLEPELQMQRELNQIRQAKGQLGAGDFEAMLAAAAQAMPDGMESPMQLTFASGQTQISGWSGPDHEADTMRRALSMKGWRTAMDADSLIIEPGED